MRVIGLAAMLTLSLIVVPLVAEAQQVGKVARVGVLNYGYPDPGVRPLADDLRELGWVQGRNLVLDRRFAQEVPERLSSLATDLVRGQMDVIVVGTRRELRAVKQMTDTVPIVVMLGGDLVGEGFVRSLARPGGNVTGLATLGDETSAKQLEFLREALPGLSRVAVLRNPSASWNPATLNETASKMTLHLQVVDARDVNDFEHAFSMMTQEHAQALLVSRDLTFFVHRARIIDLAAKKRLPTAFGLREAAESGGLMSYGHNRRDLFRLAATYVDRILRGAKPGDLPIEQPTKFELVINLKTAKALGLTIPQTLLLRADQVIE